MLKLVKKFWNDEQGLEFSEYAVWALTSWASLSRSGPRQPSRPDSTRLLARSHSFLREDNIALSA
jgi:hypothetical protein